MVDNIRLKVYHNIVVMYLRQTFPSFITLLVWLGFLYLLEHSGKYTKHQFCIFPTVFLIFILCVILI